MQDNYIMRIECDNAEQVLILKKILEERKRQDSKWGEQNHPIEKWTGILGEEYGELCQAINETIFDNGTDLGGAANIEKEAIHVAAVAISIIECMIRNKEILYDGKK